MGKRDKERVQSLPHTKSCFVCGEINPIGLRLKAETDGLVARTRWRPETSHSGFQGTVHGGLTATVLDELMVWACAVATRRFAVCAEMTVRYVQPVRPGQELVVEARMRENRRGRLFEAEASVRDEGGALMASATGKYVPISTEATRAMLTDVVGRLEAFVDL